MNIGVRLTQLGNGEPLIGSAWSYKGFSGILAAEKRLEDLFVYAKDLGFSQIIDTFRPRIDANGNLTLRNTGTFGDLWSFERRIELYKKHLEENDLDILIEVEFPTIINEDNVQYYSDYFIKLVKEYHWIRKWQVIVNPETKDNNNYKCDPINYVKFMKLIYPSAKLINESIQIGGPGVYRAIIDFLNDIPDNWLNTAMGLKYGREDSEYNIIGDKGFLPYIDFFSIQVRESLSNFTRVKSDGTEEDGIDKIRKVIKSKLNTEIPFVSLSQGWEVPFNNESLLKEQGYHELKEILLCINKGILPFKNQLVDEFDHTISNAKSFYGLLYYYLGGAGEKPACKDYKFLFNNLREFNKVSQPNLVFESNNNIDMITLINYAQDKTATIIWPREFNSKEVILQPHYARQYLLPNGQMKSIVEIQKIVLDEFKFFIVYQTINKDVVDIDEIEKRIEKKLNNTESTLKQLVSLLPNTYNKEVRDVNYYKILRSFALELADAKIEIDELRDNLYLDTAHKDYIYNNFGVLVNLQKQNDWDYEKYRRLVQGVTKSLLNGPTKESIIEAIRLFTNFRVNIHELYKDSVDLDENIYIGSNPDFTFVVEIEKPVEINAEQDSIYRDVNYVINIVKPAHTIHILFITLTGEENYQDHYKGLNVVPFQDSDKSIIDIESFENEGIFGWRHISYDGQFMIGNSLVNGGLFVGPRYVLYDSSEVDVDFGTFYDEKEFEVSESYLLEFLRFFDDQYPYENLQEFDYPPELGFDNEYKAQAEFKENLVVLFDKDFDELYNKRWKDLPHLLTDFEEVFYGVKSKEVDIQANITNEENYRKTMLLDIVNHIHKKYNKVITSQDFNTIILPNNELYSKTMDNLDSNSKVFVNGVLMPPFVYDEILWSENGGKVSGVKFHDGYLMPGDVVNVVYIKDQEVLMGEFPIIENEYHFVEFDDQERWLLLTKTKDSDYIFDIEYVDKYSFIDDKFTMENFDSKYEEIYDSSSDAVYFEGDTHYDSPDWIFDLEYSIGFKLSTIDRTLNNSILFSDNNFNRIKDIQFELNEEFPNPIDEYTKI